MTTKKHGKPKPEPLRCKHEDEYVESYFSTQPRPVVVLHCADCDALRQQFGNYLMTDYDDFYG